MKFRKWKVPASLFLSTSLLAVLCLAKVEQPTDLGESNEDVISTAHRVLDQIDSEFKLIEPEQPLTVISTNLLKSDSD